MQLDPVLQTVGLAAVIGILATWLAQRLKVPGIVLYCLAGLVFGASGLNWIDLDASAGEGAGTVSMYLMKVLPLLVAVIVFEGALMLEPEQYSHAPKAVGGLLRSGLVVTFIGTTVAAHFLLGFPTASAAVLGAVFVVTGPTVIQPILRRVRLRQAVDTALRWESILIDPIGAVLAIAVIEIAAHATNNQEIAVVVLKGVGSLAVGFVFGILTAQLTRFLLRDPRTQASREDDLNPVVLLGAMMAGFLASEAVLPESGLVTVVVAGIAAARSHFFGIHDVRQFKSLVATIVVSTIFVLLGSATDMGWANLVDPRIVLFSAALIFLVRPLSVLVATLGSKLEWRERAYVALVAPKGIVAAALASFASASLGEGAAYTEAAINRSRLSLQDASLAVITLCVLFYGLLAGPLSTLLRVREPKRERLLIVGAGPLARAFAKAAYEVGVDVSLIDTNVAAIRQAADEGLDARQENALDVERLEGLGLARARNVVAMTTNDSVNTLICRHLSELVGPAGTWQLVTAREKQGGKAAVEHGGRPAFLKGIHLAGIHYALEAGTLRVAVHTCPPDVEGDAPIPENSLPMMHVTEDGWGILGDTEVIEGYGPGESLVCLEPVEGVENPLILGLLRAAQEPAA